MVTVGSYSLATAQVDNHFGFLVILFNETSNHLLYRMHTEPITPVDERVSPDILLDKGLVEVGFIWKV